MAEDLRVLFVNHMGWNPRLGGARPQLDLLRDMAERGVSVERFGFADAFGEHRRSRLREWLGPDFQFEARRFVRAHAKRFDVIDAHQGNLPFGKSELGFSGLLVTRSAGPFIWLREVTSRFERTERRRARQRLSHARNLWLRSRWTKYYAGSLQHCDLILVQNRAEADYVGRTLAPGQRCLVIPPGLTDTRRAQFAAAASPLREKLRRATVVCITRWSPEKGSRDWPAIVRRVREAVPSAKFLFLGTGSSVEDVERDLGPEISKSVQIVPSFDPDDLPELLSGATVGAFPSYMEGFGLAVLEMLAAGLPVVAYDVPGPREMLGDYPGIPLVFPGAVDMFSSLLVRVLQASNDSYDAFGQCSRLAASRFDSVTSTLRTLNAYREGLATLSAGAGEH